ncbi:hypothetical protein P154DRAFT_208919 [Amniculicola lignicola CBS 123094]|uniref:Uncharacterized protein n=1 Tax=Amniculicola lignicola CBS 123094 TaxID=1392246 RepID=A0A6A5WEP1_9PLEO|nr:hypothetical protein P154DRAFT_208919 [Amniculicola lignicola CBS 123094]
MMLQWPEIEGTLCIHTSRHRAPERVVARWCWLPSWHWAWQSDSGWDGDGSSLDASPSMPLQRARAPSDATMPAIKPRSVQISAADRDGRINGCSSCLVLSFHRFRCQAMCQADGDGVLHIRPTTHSGAGRTCFFGCETSSVNTMPHDLRPQRSVAAGGRGPVCSRVCHGPCKHASLAVLIRVCLSLHGTPRTARRAFDPIDPIDPVDPTDRSGSACRLLWRALGYIAYSRAVAGRAGVLEYPAADQGAFVRSSRAGQHA